MKKLFLFILILSSCNAFTQINTTKSLACCDVGRGCTGSAYCSACKNCSGCKHCSKNGGSCGVCNGGRVKKYTSQKRTTKKSATETRKKPNYTYTKIKSKFNSNSYLYVSSKTLNLRKGAGTKFKIIATLLKDTRLTYLDKQNGWIKVKVVKTGLVGYVYYKYLY